MKIIIPLMGLFWGKVVKKQDDARIATLREPDGLTQVCDIPYINDASDPIDTSVSILSDRFIIDLNPPTKNL